MRVLLIGDIVGETGLEKLRRFLPKYRKENNIDFVITNGENAADGMGITEKAFKELLALGVDVVTMGNHTWAKKDIFNIITESKLLRPANYPENVPGNGYGIYECNGKKIAVISLMGRVDINVLTENPFLKVDEILEKINGVDIVIVDFHAEATAEKKALAYYLDGKIACLFGTHTHVQTNDEQILENGMAFITDIGMTGPKNSVIGMEIEASVKRFVTSLPERYKVATGEAILNGVLLEIDEKNKVSKIEKIKS